MKRGLSMGRPDPPKFSVPGEPKRPSVLTLSPGCKQACIEAVGTQMESLCLFSPVWERVEAHGCACMCSPGRVFVCEGWAAVFLVGRSLWFLVLSLRPSQGAMGQGRLAWRPSIIPPATKKIPRRFPAPSAGSSPAPHWGHQGTPGAGRRVPAQGKAGGRAHRLRPQALATASDTPWAVSSASTLSR